MPSVSTAFRGLWHCKSTQMVMKTMMMLMSAYIPQNVGASISVELGWARNRDLIRNETVQDVA